MNNTEETWPVFGTVHKYMSRTVRRFHNCFGCFRRKRIHPEVENLAESKIIRFQSNKLIRVIHLKNFSNKNGNLSNRYQYAEYSEMKAYFRSPSVSESDYSFTTWSKPLKTCNMCKMSFKDMWKEGECRTRGEEERTLTHCDTLAQCNEIRTPKEGNEMHSPVSSVEKFVEVFVREILYDTLASLFAKSDSRLCCNNPWPKEKCVCFKHTDISNREVCINVKNFLSEIDSARVSQKSIVGSDVNSGPINQNVSPDVESEFHVPTNKLPGPKTCPSTPVENHAYHNDSYIDSEGIILQKDCKDERNIAVCSHDSKTPKPILLFLHGVGCSADIWTYLLYYFAEAGYEIVAPDMLGHGYSSTPDSASAYTFHNLLQDTLDVFDKFVGETKCVVIGHAFGCSLAAAAARYRPQQVSQLVLISGGGPTPLAPRRPDFRPPAISPWVQTCLKPFLLCGLKRDFLYVPCGKHIETADSVSSGVPAYVLQHIAKGQDWPEGDSAFHRRIIVPTLLVHGMKDPYVTLVQECEMERTIPRSSLEIIANAGHFAMLETPGRLCHMIHAFIDWWNV